MISLTYISTATHHFTQPDLESLLDSARSDNEHAGITGMLLFADDHFIQTIEGDRTTVEDLFGRISADGRHRDVVVALRDEVDGRAFPTWTMGFRTMTSAEIAAVPGFSDFLDPRSESYRDVGRLGRPGIFHRIFRDTLHPEQ